MSSINGTLELDVNFTKLKPESQEIINPMAVSKTMEAVMHVMYISVSAAAIGGNGMICYIILAYQRMRTVTNFFILNLAIGDILMACLCIPFGFVSNLLLQYWPFGEVMCVLVSYAQVVSVFVSAYTMIAISIDRYIAILYPLRPRMSKLQAKITILFIWIVALITPLPTALLSELKIHPAWIGENKTQRYICVEAWTTPEKKYHYSMALMILQYFFPLSVLLYTYTRIGIIVWGNRPPGEAEDIRDQKLAASKRKMVKMMITVVTVFSLCWLPLNILIVVGDLDESLWQYENIVYVWFVCHWLAMSHASYNPIIYCWMNSMFRDGFHQICHRFSCAGFRRKRNSDESNLHRGNTYSTCASVRNMSLAGPSPRLLFRNDKFIIKPSPTPSTRLMVQHACHYVSDDDLVTDTEV